MSKEDHHYHGAIECKACHSVFPIKEAPNTCTNCGAKLEAPETEKDLKLLGHEKIQSFLDKVDDSMEDVGMLRDGGAKSLAERVKGPVSCCWCGDYYAQRGERVNCDSCGGNLPMPACSEPGPEPEREPRDLPAGYWSKLFIKQNVTLRVSLFLIFVPIFLFVFMPPLILGTLLGMLLLMWNFYDLNKRYKALKKGKAVLGKIEKVQAMGEANNPKNTEMGKVDSGLMFRLYFHFEVDGKIVKGMKYTHDPVAQDYFTGQPVWVVYLEKKKKCYSLWPPIA